MISYIKGIVENIENDKVIIDNNGIGYGIFMPGHVLDTIGIGEELKIYTYLISILNYNNFIKFIFFYKNFFSKKSHY